MKIKTHDNYKNERLELLMEAVGNALLEGELCPNCFEQYSSEDVREAAKAALKSEGDRITKARLRDAIAKMKSVKEDSVLTLKDSSDELIREYICKKCHRSYVGELNLIANLNDTQVLSFFGHDDTRSYTKDFYSFSLIDDSYDSFVKELWDDEVDPSIEEATITPHMIRTTDEDAISGEVLGMLKRFFVKFSKVVFNDIGSRVGVYSVYHAGSIESGRREGVPATGADAAIWIGPMTKDDMQAVNDYVNEMPNAQLPVLVGNGVVLQAKKENGGKMERRQIEDLIKFASIEYKGHEYLGVPGKLFMNYSTKQPLVTILSCDFTYQLYSYSKQLPENQKSISFPMSLNMFAEHAKPIALPEFVQLYLSGKIGTPLLMLQDIFATPGPKLIVGLPPELLQNPHPNRQSPLAAMVDGVIAALGQRLEKIEQSEAAYAEPETLRTVEAESDAAIYNGHYHGHVQPEAARHEGEHFRYYGYSGEACAEEVEEEAEQQVQQQVRYQ